MFPQRRAAGFAHFALLLAGTLAFEAFPQAAVAADWLDWLPALNPQKPETVVVVQAGYPGATAQVLMETVAAPIEQQVLGVENMSYMRSRCAADGSYMLEVTLARGADADLTQVLVQNRVALALPQLPEEVQRRGVVVKKRSPRLVMILSIHSPDNSRDVHYLSNYTTVQVLDELCRLPGVAELTGIGQSEYGMQVWLAPERMAANNLTAGDVVTAIREEAARLTAGRAGAPAAGGGQAWSATADHGRLDPARQIGNLVLKTGAAGRVVCLRDIAQIALGGISQRGHALLAGKPIVALAVYPVPAGSPQKASTAVRTKLAELRARFPAGIACEVSLDFAPPAAAVAGPADPGYLLFDLALPSDASTGRIRKTLEDCDARLHGVAGVRDVLALSENPFDTLSTQAALLVRLTPADQRRAGREEIARTIRARLAGVAGATARRRDSPGPGRSPAGGYPVNLAVYRSVAVFDGKMDKHRDVANRFAKRLRGSGKLTDVWVDPASVPCPQVRLDIDRAKTSELGVRMSDVTTAREASLGSVNAGEFREFGRTWPILVGLARGGLKQPADALKSLVRSSTGQVVPLSAVASAKEEKPTAPAVIDRLDLYPMMQITASPAPNVPPAEIRALCEPLMAEVRQELGLTDEYRVRWLEP
jgi:multidrug efflux pump subunit AcrB